MRQIGYSVVKFSVPILATSILILSLLMDLFGIASNSWIFGLIAWISIIFCFLYSSGLFEIHNFILATDKQYNDAKKLINIQQFQNSEHSSSKKQHHGVIHFLLNTRLVMMIRYFYACIKLMIVMFIRCYSWLKNIISKWTQKRKKQQFVLLADNKSESTPFSNSSKYSKQKQQGHNLMDIFDVEKQRKESSMAGTSKIYSNDDYTFEDDEMADKKIYSQQYKILFELFVNFLTKRGVDKKDFKKYLIQMKYAIGQLILDVVDKNKENLNKIKEATQKIFDINVVKKQQLQQDSPDGYYGNFGNKMRENKKTTVESIMENQKDDLITKGVWGFRQNFLIQTKQEKKAAFRQLKELIMQRINLDKQINFDHEIKDQKKRDIMIEELYEIGSALKRNGSLRKFSKRKDPTLRINQINKIVLWVMRNEINDLVGSDVPEAKIFLDKNYVDLHGENRKNYIKIYGKMYQHGNHYNLEFVQKVGDSEQMDEFIGKPGDDNIFSIFVWYCILVKEKYGKRIGNIGKMHKLIEETILI